MKKLLLLLALLFIPSSASAQVGNMFLRPFIGVPSGTCAAPLGFAQNTTNGDFFACDAGTWLKIGPGVAGGGSQHQIDGVNLISNDPINFLDTTEFDWTNPTAGNLSLALKAGFVNALADLAATLCGTTEILEDQGGSWACIATPSGAAHNILSATHLDTTAATVVRGDLMTGQLASPVWQRLALGATNLYPKSDGTDLVFSTLAAGGVGACGANQFETADNADAVPTCVQPNFTNLSGTATKGQLPTVAAYEDEANIFTLLNLFRGSAATDRLEVENPDTPADNSFADSPFSLFTGIRDSDAGAGIVREEINWRSFVDVTAVAGTSDLLWQSRIGVAAFAEQGKLTDGGVFDVVTGFRIGGLAAVGARLRGDGTNFISDTTQLSGVGSCTNQFARALNNEAAPTCAPVNLTADVTATLPVGSGGTGTPTAFTLGSVVFIGTSGVYAQDNANFFWDDTANRLGLGTATPVSIFEALTTANSATEILSITVDPATPANGDEAQIAFRLDPSGAGAVRTFGRIDVALLDVTDGAERSALGLDVWDSDGAGTMIEGFNLVGQTGQDEAVINIGQVDLDFRVAAIGVVNALLVQGSNGDVGMGISPPGRKLHLHTTDVNGPDIFFTDADTGTVPGTDGLQLGMDDNEFGFFWNYETAGDIYFGAGNSEIMRLDGLTGRVFFRTPLDTSLSRTGVGILDLIDVLDANVGFRIAGAAASTNALIGDGTNFVAGQISSSQLATANKTITCNITLFRDTGLKDTDDLFSVTACSRPGRALTITVFICECDAGSPVVNAQRDDGTPANILTSNLTCTTSGATGTLDATEKLIAATDRFDFVAVSGMSGANQCSMNIQATVD